VFERTNLPMSMLCFSNRVCLFAQTILKMWGKLERMLLGFPSRMPRNYWWIPWRPEDAEQEHGARIGHQDPVVEARAVFTQFLGG
jgi:hypothetical protein